MSTSDTTRIELKQGATLSLAGTATLPTGTWTATCKAIGNSGKFTTTLDVTLTNTSGSTSHAITIIKAATYTADWPEGDLVCDLRFEDATGVVIITPVFTISVLKRATHV